MSARRYGRAVLSALLAGGLAIPVLSMAGCASDEERRVEAEREHEGEEIKARGEDLEERGEAVEEQGEELDRPDIEGRGKQMQREGEALEEAGEELED